MTAFGSWTVPFAEQKATPLDTSDAILCGGIIVMAAKIPTGDGQIWPAIVFRFDDAEHRFSAPIVLVMPTDQLTGLTELVATAVATAVRQTT